MMAVFIANTASTFWSEKIRQQISHLPRTSYCPGELVSFTNTTTPGDTTVKTTAWDFGDGNVTNSNGNVSKTYNNAGNYTIKMTVRDNFNCASTISKTAFITVNPKHTNF